MGGSMIKLATLLICMNTMLYIGLGVAQSNDFSDPRGVKLPGDIFDIYLEDKESLGISIDESLSSINSSESLNKTVVFSPKSEFSKPPSLVAAESVSDVDTGFTFIDGLRIALSFLPTLVNIGLVPLTLLTASTIPIFVAFPIGLPLAFMWFILLIGFIAGRST